MTGRLKDTLQRQAEALEPPDLDLAAITAAGRRRTRLRTVAVVGVAAAAVVAGSVTLGSGPTRHEPSRRSVGSDPSSAATRPTQSSAPDATGDGSLLYAVGDVIHSGGTTVDVGKSVEALVRTSAGVVFSDASDRVFAVDNGHAVQIGRLATASTSLLADTAGTTVAWLGADGLEVYRVGLSTPVTVPLQDPPGFDTPVVTAVWDGTVWFWDARGTMTYDASSGSLDHVAGLDAAPAPVEDVVGDRLLIWTHGPGVEDGMAVLRLPVDASAQPQVTGTTTGDLSPDGDHWFTADGRNRDEFDVVDSGSGDFRTPTYQGGGFVTPYAWLDNDTIAAWTVPGVDGGNPVDLLTCRVSTNTCTLAAPHIGAFGAIAIDGQPTS